MLLRKREGFPKESRCSIDVGISIAVFSFLRSRTAMSLVEIYVCPRFVSLVDNATLTGSKRSTLYISSYTGLSYTCCVVQRRLSSTVEVYKYIHTYVQHVGRDRRLPRSIPKYRIACTLPLKRLITGMEGEKERSMTE